MHPVLLPNALGFKGGCSSRLGVGDAVKEGGDASDYVLRTSFVLETKQMQLRNNLALSPFLISSGHY